MEQARTARIKSISFSIRTSWPEKSWIKRPWIRYSSGEIRPRKHRAGLEHRIFMVRRVTARQKENTARVCQLKSNQLLNMPADRGDTSADG